MTKDGREGRILYLQCESGISGDMVAGALLDLGASEKHLRAALASLPLSGYEARVTRRQVGVGMACDFDVVLDAEHENHDHDMAYLYGDLGGAGEGLEGRGTHGHHHDHEAHDHHEGHEHHDAGGRAAGHAAEASHAGAEHHDHAHHHHHHEHRTLAEVNSIIDAGRLTPRASATAHRIFQVLAEGEAKAHATTIDQVHFHEVGAVDSIVDIVTVAVCLDDLGITDVAVGPLAEGHGRVRTQHGVLAVPVPAVAHIAADYGLPMTSLDRAGEFVTPTGAAIAAALRTRDTLPEPFRLRGIGIGSGKRAYEPVSTVRALLVEPVEPAGPKETASVSGSRSAASAITAAGSASAGTASAGADASAAGAAPADGARDAAGLAPDADAAGPRGDARLWQLTCEVDDCTGEALGFALERLFAIGVREAHYVPVYMKKNRPAWQIQVLCDETLIPAAERVLFEDVTTIGIRRHPVERTCLPRQELSVETPYGAARAKAVTLPSGARRAYPEYESVAALAREQGIAFQEAYRAVLAAADAADATSQTNEL